MGYYLNSASVSTLYRSETQKPYFVDKTSLLSELFPLVEQGNQHICITRPRRFGKSVMASMVGAFFGKGNNCDTVFNQLEIAVHPKYNVHLNQHNVIYIDFSKLPRNCDSYASYIGRIEERLGRDLRQAYPDINLEPEDAVWDMLSDIFEYTGDRFIFVFDEWDCIFHKEFIVEQDKREYINFLAGLTKDQAYVSLVYMTGILPIAKYSSGSSMNNFAEYTMVTQAKYSEYFGFTETEVDALYQRYQEKEEFPTITREELRQWYNGYHAKSGERMYNPRSVVYALSNNQVANYWTNSGPYDEIFYYIENNVDDVRDDLALMIAGESVPLKVQEYAATAMELHTRDEIFSAMVVYGFLSYEDGRVRIPNQELMDKFDELIRRESSLGYVYQLAKESERMLAATLRGDTEVMGQILEFAHNTETPILSYNSEVELSAIVNLVYLSARDRYRVEREDKAGLGFVDFVFYPYKKDDEGIILELKVDHTPEEAVQQIKDKQYALCFAGKQGEQSGYCGRILAVGIGYSRESKKHRCVVEVL